METSTSAGLTVSYEEETSTISFEWDEETHPEYNFLKDLTPELFTAILLQHCNKFDSSTNG